MVTDQRASQKQPGTTIEAAIRVVMITAIGVLAFFGLWTGGPAAAQEAATISILVVDANGPVTGVQVDLFASDESGQRLGWIQSQTTEQGSIEFAVAPGCYVTTAIAPRFRAFTNRSQWSNRADCVQAGDVATGVTTFADADTFGQVSGNVRHGAIGVDDMSIGVFEATADGSRGRWLLDVLTGRFGDYETLLSPGCYVLTAVAPNDEDVFENTGTRWDNQPVCLADGEQRSINFSILPTSTSRIQVQVVDSDFEAVSDVQVDLYTTDPFLEMRVEWIESTLTGPDGVAGYDVGDGCWAMTAIAPDDRTFADSGTRWEHFGTCLPRGGGLVLEPVIIQLADE